MLLCLLLAAQTPLQDARAALARGQELATLLKASEAVEQFEKALVAFQAVPADQLNRDEVYSCWIEIGALWLAEKKGDAADSAFRRALAFDAKKTPDPNLYPPDVIDRFARTKKALLKKAKATLTLNATPEGAQVWLDGVKVGEAPGTFPDIVEGEHWITFEKTDYAPVSTVVVVSAGKFERADVVLRSTKAPAPPKKVIIEVPPIAPATEPFVEEQVPAYKRAWFWVVIGGVVVAAAVGIGLGVGLQPDTRPGGVDFVIR